MWFKYQPWNRAPDDCDPYEIEWNMWSRRQPPYEQLEAGCRVITVGLGGPKHGELLWEVEITSVAKGRYDGLDEAWSILTKGLGSVALQRAGHTRRTFKQHPYTQGAASRGWILGFASRPLRRLGAPRPVGLRLRPNGWAWRDGPLIGGQTAKSHSGQGRISDPMLRRIVEDTAMSVARQWLIAQGHAPKRIVDTHRHSPYDFAIVDRHDYEHLRVEVKGLTGAFGSVSVTAGEVKAAREDGVRTALVIVWGIELAVDDSGTWRASGGRPHIVDPWHPSDRELSVESYRLNPRLKLVSRA